MIDKITGAGVVQFSRRTPRLDSPPTPTRACTLRTAPPDLLQGRSPGELVAGDGHKNVAVINRNDSYGVGLTESLTAAPRGRRQHRRGDQDQP
ncbi:MAG: hypothetical protein R2749_04315 [Acidimicrobiales bacterium]